jgi:hypothetical protein
MTKNSGLANGPLFQDLLLPQLFPKQAQVLEMLFVRFMAVGSSVGISF